MKFVLEYNFFGFVDFEIYLLLREEQTCYMKFHCQLNLSYVLIDKLQG